MANKITISNFSGMGQGGTYYLDGMRPHKIGNESILTTSHYCSDFSNEDDTNQSAFKAPMAIAGFSTASTDSPNDFFITTMDAAGVISMIDDSISGTGNLGAIHTAATSSQKPDIAITQNNSILYSAANNLGMGRYFTATGGSTTTIVVSGEDFDTNYDYADGDKLYNITKKEEYTIDTGGVGSTTLTLVEGTACAADDLFIVFNDDEFDFGTTSIYGNHFNGQNTTTSWVRQIKLLGDDYWILNGNYIASLNIDESTFAAEAKQLPYQHQSTCFDTNQQNMLVGADYLGQGKLLMWDTYSNGWLSTLDIASPPQAIRAYKNGWIVVLSNGIYFTNGYELRLMSNFPDLLSSRDLANVNHNGIEVLNDNIYIAANMDRLNRAKTGVWSYRPEEGWGYAPLKTPLSSVYKGNATAIKSISLFGLITVWVGGDVANTTSKQLLNRLYEDGAFDYSAMLYIKLPSKMRISGVDLNIASKLDSYDEIASTTDVTVSYSDGKNAIWEIARAGSGCSTTSIVNKIGDAHPATVGQQLLMVEGNAGGDVSWIQSITGAGTTSETWVISPALSAAPVDTDDIVVVDMAKTDTKTINPWSIPNNLKYNISDFYSDKLFLEVRFNGTSGTGDIDLHAINIY